MQKTPKISILIPTYNAEKFIEKTLEGVFRQGRPADEVIVLDDGSTDNTFEILKKFEPRIKILTQKNKGVSNARNRLLAEAKGDLIGFLDHDDFWGQDYLKHQVENFEKFPDASCYVAGFVSCTKSSQMQDDHLDADALTTQNLNVEEFLNLYSTDTGLFLPSFTLFRRDHLTKVGEEVFPESCSGADDVFIFLVMSLFGEAVLSDRKVGFFRMSPTSQSQDRLKSYVSRNIALEEVCEFYRQQATNKNYLSLVQKMKAVSARGLAKIYFGEKEYQQGREVLKNSLRQRFDLKSFVQLLLSIFAISMTNTKNRYRPLP